MSADVLFGAFKRIHFIVLLVIPTYLLAITHLNADDVKQSDVDAIKVLIAEEKYPEALDQFIAIRGNILKNEEADDGMKLAYLMYHCSRLANVSPEAKDKLKAIRDEDMQKGLTGIYGYLLFYDAALINDILEQTSETIKLFEIYHKENPALALLCYPIAKDALMETKRFDLLKIYAGDLLIDYKAFAKDREIFREVIEQGKYMFPKSKYFLADKEFVCRCLQLIEVANHIDKPDQAEEIRKRAFELIEDQQLRDCLSEKMKFDDVENPWRNEQPAHEPDQNKQAGE